MGEQYVPDPHVWGGYKCIPWKVCCHCGLVALKNEFTKWCIKKGCNHHEHPQYQSVRKTLTG